jgi:hypothetical protein
MSVSMYAATNPSSRTDRSNSAIAAGTSCIGN